MGISTAAIVGGGLSAAGSLASGIMGSNAAEDAANAQLTAANNANALQWKMYQQNRSDMMPWLTAGTGAVNRLSTGLQPGGEYDKFTMADFTADPGYQYRQKEGVNALRAGSSAAGNFGSGNMGAALTSYGQNLANNEYQNAYGRWLDSYNRVAGLAGTGQQQSQAMASSGTNTANAMNANTLAGGIANAYGIVGSANALSGGITGVGNQIMGGLGTYMNYQQNQSLLNALQGGSYGNTGSYQMGGANYMGPTMSNPINWGG